MTTWAHIDNGIVVEITETDPEGRFNPALLWVPCAPEVGQNWTYDGTTFAAPVPPPPTPAEVLAGKIAEGLVVTCTGDGSVSGTYGIDPDTMETIGSVARDVGAGLGFPDGDTYQARDIAGNPHTFTEPRLILLYKAQRLVLSRVNTAAAILANGGAPSWPDQTATIP